MPDSADVELSLGGLYMDTGEYDKARVQLSKVLQADPKNARVLWQMGGLEIVSGNTEGAFEPLDRGLALAVQADNQEAKALILQAIGVAYGLTNKPQEALNNYQQSLEINQRLGQKWGMAASLSQMAQVYSLLGQPDKTLASLNETLKIEQEIGAKKEAGDTLIDLGNFYDERGRHDQALEMFKESLQIQRDSGDENYQALCLSNIGNTYFSIGQYQDALTYFQQALTLREKLKVPAGIAGTVESLAQTTVRLNQYDEAARLFLRALDLYRKAGDGRSAAGGSGKLATLFIYEGRYGAAVNSSEDAVKTFRDLKDRSPVMAEMLNAYGDALAEAGRLDEAQKILNEALGLARELNSQDVVADVLAGEAKVALYRGDFKSAQALYSQSLNSASRTKDRETVLVSKIGLAKIKAAKAPAREAAANFEGLAQEADRMGSAYLSAECAIDASEARVGAKDYARARQALEPALNSSDKLGMRAVQVRAHYFLGTILRLSGNSSEASGQYQQALSLLEQIRKEPGAENVLQRVDLGSLYEDATRWVQPPKAN
jgi:tetratricopeptide (TPR) repeat protein